MGELNLLIYCLASNFLVIGGVERQVPRKHQVDDDAKTPAVNTFVIWLLQENFWRNITQGSKWLFAYLTWTKCLAQPKIDQLDL